MAKLPIQYKLIYTTKEGNNMFTIKLYRNSDNYTVMCCPNYSVETLPDSNGSVIEITLYKDFTTQNGVSYRVSKEHDTIDWKYAFIENVSGKTIDHIKCGSL